MLVAKSCRSTGVRSHADRLGFRVTGRMLSELDEPSADHNHFLESLTTGVNNVQIAVALAIAAPPPTQSPHTHSPQPSSSSPRSSFPPPSDPSSPPCFPLPGPISPTDSARPARAPGPARRPTRRSRMRWPAVRSGETWSGRAGVGDAGDIGSIGRSGGGGVSGAGIRLGRCDETKAIGR